MTQLGSIFEPAPEGARGRDLHHEVTVPAWAAGYQPGVDVDVPRELAATGGYVPRVVSAFDPGTAIHIHLPGGFPSGGALRLRGQGEPVDGGSPGDLILVVRLDTSQTTPPPGPPLLPMIWPPGQVLANAAAALRPEAPRALVLWVVLAFAVGAAVVYVL